MEPIVVDTLRAAETLTLNAEHSVNSFCPSVDDFDSDEGSQVSSDSSPTAVASSNDLSGLIAAEPTRRSPPSYVTAAESFAGMSLADAMPRRKLRLEKERDAALALNRPRTAPVRHREDAPSLDSLLRPHKSGMERAKEAALAANEPRKAPIRTYEADVPFDAVLKPHKSQLEKAKEAAIAKNEPRRPPSRKIDEQIPLEFMLKKSYSLVEREKMAAAAAAAQGRDSMSPSAGAVSRKSRLQIEKEAAQRLSAANSAAVVVETASPAVEEAHVSLSTDASTEAAAIEVDDE